MKATSLARPVRALRVLCAEPQNYSKKALKAIATYTDFESADLSQEEFVTRSNNYDALMVRIQRQITGKMIASSPNLKAILSPTTGTDHIDIETAMSHNVVVFSLRGEIDFLRNIHSSAEYTFALLLSLLRNIPQAVDAVKQNTWAQAPYRGNELNGKTLGIVGYGRIGTKVARYGNGFGMKICAYDPFVERFPKYVLPADSLDALLRISNILCICVPLNKQTKGLIGARELFLLQKGSFLINTARGDVINETSLAQCLQQEHLAGAAVDVLTNENLIPANGHPLIEYAKTHSNLLITPHIAGTAVEAIEKTDLFIVNKFKSWAENYGAIKEV